MKYMIITRETAERRLVDYDEALRIALGSYKDNDMTRDMLTIPNNVQCVFSTILIREDNGDFEKPIGAYNLTPEGISYDIHGNHKKGGE